MAKKHTEHPESHTEAVPEAQGISPDQGEAPAKTPPTVMERAAESAESVTEAVREGADDAREAAAGFIPAVGNFLHKGIYNGFYYLTYGVVFGSLVVGSIIPSNSAVSEGMRDGAQAAKRAFEHGGETAAEAGPAEEGLVAS